MTKHSEQPLRGVRIVDISTSYAGPTATMYLADLGAEVIKVERPGGDDSRGWGPPFIDGQAAWFVSANRNKRSVVIDIRTEAGAALLRDMIATADVFVENLNPAKLVRHGLDPATLRAAHPKLVYCAVSGFGLTGPDSHLPGYDLIAQARSGLMSVTGAAGGPPQRMSTALCDIVTGMAAAIAILAVLRRVAQGGDGDVVDTALLDSGLALMSPRITSYGAGEPEPAPSGSTDSVISIYQSFRTADRPIVIAVGNDAIWRRLCATLGLDALSEDPALGSNAGRRAHRDRIVSAIEAVLATAPATTWLARLGDATVPCAEVAFLSNVVADPHVVARGNIVSLPRTASDAENSNGDHPADSGGAQIVTAPWRLVDTPATYRPAPEAGADTFTVLRELGLDDERIASLASAGAIQGPAGTRLTTA